MVGLSHRSTPVGLLERAAVGAEEAPKLLDEMMRGSHVIEAMILSTCNRIEVYAVVDAFHGGLGGRRRACSAGMPGCRRPSSVEHLYVHHAGSALQHLFAVAAGLDSMVVGEVQILAQLRAAYAAAERGRCGRGGRCTCVVPAGRCGSASGCAPVPDIDAAGRLRSSPKHSRRPRARRWAELPVTWPAFALFAWGAGAMGALAAAHLRRAVCNRGRSCSIGPRSGVARLADNVLRLPTPRPGSAPLCCAAGVELAAADVLVACTGAIDTAPLRDLVRWRDHRPGAGVRSWSVTSGCPATSTPAVSELPGCHRRSTWAALRRGRLMERCASSLRGWWAGGAVSWSPIEAQASPRCPALRGGRTDGQRRCGRRASDVIDAELQAALRAAARPGPPGCARSSPAPHAGSSTSSCTPPPCRSSGWPRARTGTSYTRALRELFPAG